MVTIAIRTDLGWFQSQLDYQCIKEKLPGYQDGIEQSKEFYTAKPLCYDGGRSSYYVSDGKTWETLSPSNEKFTTAVSHCYKSNVTKKIGIHKYARLEEFRSDSALNDRNVQDDGQQGTWYTQELCSILNLFLL